MKVIFTFVVKSATPPPPNPLAVTPPGGAIPDETVGVDPGAQVIAVVSGGTPPYAVKLSNGSLPAGQNLDLNNENGNIELTGVPSEEQTGSFELEVTDASGQTA